MPSLAFLLDKLSTFPKKELALVDVSYSILPQAAPTTTLLVALLSGPQDAGGYET